MKVLLTLLVAGTLASLGVHAKIGVASVPVTGGSTQATSSGPAPSAAGPRRISSYADMSGCYMLADGRGEVQIVDFLWGLDTEGVLVPAFVTAIDRNGDLIEVDDRSVCLTVFNKLEDITACYAHQAGQLVIVDEIGFGLDSGGFLINAGMRGMTLSGFAFGMGVCALGGGDPPPTAQCACQYSLHCTAGNCSSPSNCVGSYPCNCQGSNRCGSGSSCNCPVLGYCATGNCVIDPAAVPPKCVCQ